jgi:DNA-binding Lrp family transcriptional regulator
MLKIKKKDITILAYLRQHARIPLTKLSRKSGIPVSTLFDKLKTATPFVHKYTALINFQPLGFGTRAMVVLKVKKDQRGDIKEHLTNHKHVNSMYKINNGCDYLLDIIFTDMKELEDFLDDLEVKFKIEKKHVFYLLDIVKEEDFLSSPEYVKHMFP